jgi:hypothetical protein
MSGEELTLDAPEENPAGILPLLIRSLGNTHIGLAKSECGSVKGKKS